jgi:hypothetical protein
MQPPRLRYLGKVAGLTIYLVSGVKVRNQIDIDFTCGGNEAVYPSYVPAGEIWLDDAAGPLDRTATALHEIVERDQMMRFGKDYDHGHDVASAHERPFRQALASRPPKEFDPARVAAAYRTYLRDPDRCTILPRPDEPKKKTGRALDREVYAALASRAGR